MPLPVGVVGLDVYRPVYREGAPTRTVAQRRAALVGFAVGAFRVRSLAAAAISAVPHNDTVQLRIGGRDVIGPRSPLEDPASAPIHVADRVWLLVVLDPDRPDIGLPILMAAVGISLASLLGALILVWSRNERMEELRREAGQDSLTGLKNRRRFEEDLRGEMARSRRMGRTGALLMLDLDNFKRVNDSLGHPAGDRLIKEIANVLRRSARETDVLARLGGDEFAIVLPNCDVEEAQMVAETIAAAIREHASAEEERPAGHRQHRHRDVRGRSANQLRVGDLRGRHRDVRGQGRGARRGQGLRSGRRPGRCLALPPHAAPDLVR